MLLIWHPSLSRGLVATESRRASCPLGDLLVQSDKGLSSLESGFDPVYCVFIWSETNATRTERQFLRQVLRA